MKQRIVSGIQPSSDILHIGNYFGAVRQWLELQKEKECYFFIADLHALTEPANRTEFSGRVLNIAKDYIALGLDKSHIFLQSSVPEHTQLMWILSAVTAMGDLERMTQYKDKSQRITKEEGANAGLFLYPVLMAADILLYQADQVPVGEDQYQHIELTREIARRFNHRFGKNGFEFKIPEIYSSVLGERVMSLNDPTKKMSKSLGNDSYIGIFENLESIQKKMARAVTDSGNDITYDPESRPGLANLLELYAMTEDLSLNDDLLQDIAKTYKNKFGEFKKDFAKKIFDYFADKRDIRKEITDENVHNILNKGAEDAGKIAKDTIKNVKKVVGFFEIQ